MNTESQIHPKVIVAIQKQINEILKKTADWIKLVPNEIDTTDIQADISGPVGTPYQGGTFRCKLAISSEFPKVAPKGYFLTKIFHPNVSEKGEICVNTLKKDWDSKNWSLYGIFEVIKCLLIVPFPESALNEDAAKMFMENYEEYFKHAKLLTELHAMPKSNPLSKFTSSPMKGISSDRHVIGYDNFSPIKQFNLSSSSCNTNNNQCNVQQGEIQLIKENVSESISINPMIKSEKPNNLVINQTHSITFNTNHINLNLNSSNTNNNNNFSMDNCKTSDDVLMTVTNSLNTNNNMVNLAFKKSGSLNVNANGNNNMMNTMQIIPQINSSTSNIINNNNTTNLTTSAKKENEKKLWMKRI